MTRRYYLTPHICVSVTNLTSSINAYRRCISLVCLALLFTFSTAIFSQAENKNSGNSAPDEAQRLANDSSTFSFMGLVEASESFRIILHPGESVKQVFIQEGDTVKKDQVLVQLGNDTLTSATFDLLQKKSQLQKEKEQIEILALQEKMKKRQLNRIEEEIQEEARLTSQVEGYISTVSKQLDNQKMIIAGELEVLHAKMNKMREGEKQYEMLHGIITNQLAELEKRKDRLLIKTPIASQVVFVSPDSLRTPPGGVVCELWGTSAYRVRGRVMQHQIEHILIGDTVEISLDFSKKAPLTGKITLVQQSRMSPESRGGGYPTFDVLVAVDGVAQWIKPGMMVSMKKVEK